MIKKFENFKNDIDPFNEENWEEKDYDYYEERHGLRVWHYEGDPPEKIGWNVNVDEYTKYIIEKNPKKNLENDPKGFWAGFGTGILVENAKWQIKTKSK